jgi:hypothetical protein
MVIPTPLGFFCVDIKQEKQSRNSSGTRYPNTFFAKVFGQHFSITNFVKDS